MKTKKIVAILLFFLFNKERMYKKLFGVGVLVALLFWWPTKPYVLEFKYQYTVGVYPLPFALPQILFETCIFHPMRFLYLNGPSLRGYGGWSGTDWPDICSHLSNVKASFWEQHPEECLTQIDKQVLANIILLGGVTFVITLGLILHFVVQPYLVYRLVVLALGNSVHPIYKPK